MKEGDKFLVQCDTPTHDLYEITLGGELPRYLRVWDDADGFTAKWCGNVIDFIWAQGRRGDATEDGVWHRAPLVSTLRRMAKAGFATRMEKGRISWN